MANTRTLEESLKQLLELHMIDLAIMGGEKKVRECRDGLDNLADGVSTIEEGLSDLETRVNEVRLQVRRGERAADEKRDSLSRIRNRVSNVQNERQYSAASLEFDLVKRDLRTLEDRVLEQMQALEDVEGQRKELSTKLEETRVSAGPQREEFEGRLSQLEDELAISKEKRENIALRIDARKLAHYDRVRSGRSEVALASVTDEGVCGNCHTFVTVQQQMEIREMKRLIACEGCGVILISEELGPVETASDERPEI